MTTVFMSACSFSTAPASGLTVMERHAWPKRRHAVPWSTSSAELESASSTWSMLEPPSPFCRIIVSFDSRKGMFLVPSARHLTTSASLVSDRLILRPSLADMPGWRGPFLRPSEPETSTRMSCALRLPLLSTHATLNISRQCERAELTLKLVAPCALAARP